MLLSRSYVYGLYQLLCCIVVEGSYNLHIICCFLDTMLQNDFCIPPPNQPLASDFIKENLLSW